MVRRIYNTFQFLSLDVTLGVMVNGVVLGWVFRTFIAPEIILLLGISVWLIYMTDHLLDTRGKQGTTLSNRHQYFLSHRRKLIGLTALAFLMVPLLIIRIPYEMLRAGIILVFFVGVYLFTHHYFMGKRQFHKEFLGAMIYSTGIYLPVFILFEQRNPILFVCYGAFFLLAFVNLIIYAYMDHDLDKKCGFPSLVNTIGLNIAEKIIKLLFLLVSALLVIMIINSNAGRVLYLALGYAIILFVHITIFLNRTSLNSDDAYRILGDLSFLLPGLIITVSGFNGL
jgi:4-hydroxybenzoate polyprenyltransferase